MKIIICAIARNEGPYIRDFCEYHFRLGFDEIHLFDNGTDIPVEDPRLTVYPFRNNSFKSPQMNAYNGMLGGHGYDCSWDWCAFVDIDEFITMPGISDIHEYMSGVPEGVDSVAMKSIVYGDSGIIEPEDISVPVYERLTQLSKVPLGAYPKHIVRRSPNIRMLNPHVLLSRKPGVEPASFDAGDSCYVRHYKTKTLSEFCDQKLNTPRVFNQTEKRKLSYYFMINEKTPEKIAYLKSRGIEIE